MDEKLQKAVREYRFNGAILLRDVLSDEWVEKVTKAIEKVHKIPSKEAQHFCYIGGSGSHFRDFRNWNTVPEINNFIKESPVAELAAKLMESSTATLFLDQITIKDPRDLHLTPYHVEISSYPFAGQQALSMVIPIDDVPLESSLKFVQGSHNWKRTFYPLKIGVGREHGGGNRGSFHEDDGKNSDWIPGSSENKVQAHSVNIDGEHLPDIRDMKEAMVLEWTMHPGDILVYNMNTLMASNGNVTNKTQRALLIHWLGDDARYVQRRWPVLPAASLECGLRPGQHPSENSAIFPVLFPHSTELLDEKSTTNKREQDPLQVN